MHPVWRQCTGMCVCVCERGFVYLTKWHIHLCCKTLDHCSTLTRLFTTYYCYAYRDGFLIAIISLNVSIISENFGKHKFALIAVDPRFSWHFRLWQVNGYRVFDTNWYDDSIAGVCGKWAHPHWKLSHMNNFVYSPRNESLWKINIACWWLWRCSSIRFAATCRWNRNWPLCGAFDGSNACIVFGTFKS